MSTIHIIKYEDIIYGHYYLYKLKLAEKAKESGPSFYRFCKRDNAAV